MIPKIIHYCWISNDEFPENICQYFATWKAHLPDYEFILWDYNKIVSEQAKREEFGGNLWLEQTIQTKKYAFAADYIRVYALHQYGGIYLDMDVELRNSFDPFLKDDLFIGFDYLNDLEPAVLGSIPGHPWIRKMLEYYRNRSFIQTDGGFSQSPLPILFEEASSGLFTYRRDGKQQNINRFGITIFPYDYFSPKDVYANKIRKTSNTIAIHHFDGSWVRKNFRFYFKRRFHQVLYTVGGKQFHDRNIDLWRRTSKRAYLTFHRIIELHRSLISF